MGNTLKMSQNTDKLTAHDESECINGIECISLIGTKMYFTIEQLPVFLKQVDIWIIFLAFIALMSILDPTNILQRGGYGPVVFVWFCMAAIYTGLTIMTLTTWCFFLRDKRINSVILPINGFIIVCALITLYPYLEKPVLGELAISPSVIHIKNGLAFFVIEQVFITLYVSLGFPLAVRNLGLEGIYPSGYFSGKSKAGRPEEHSPIQKGAFAPPSQLPNLIQIGAESFDVRNICYISAEEHYVKVKTVSEEALIRDKLSQVITRFDDGVGFQVHRSHWVALSCVQNVIRHDKQHKIQMRNGELIPISEARRHSFQECLLLYRAEFRALV